MSSYRGRFAPSPTGPLHAGSLVAALASWLDARAHGGTWLVRIEDVDAPRCVPGADAEILRQLAVCGLLPDEEPVWQSRRSALYQQALDRLVDEGKAYPCACSRKDIEEALRALGRERMRGGELVYPGTCREGLQGRPARAWRFRVDGGVAARTHPTGEFDVRRVGSRSDPTTWRDRRLGQQSQDVAQDVGDFVLKRADGLFAYQLAVVVDDADQGITHVVRGEDLADNTARQLLLQDALMLPTPTYLHSPLVLGANGEKLSKQNGAAPLDLRDPLAALQAAGGTLGLAVNGEQTLAHWLSSAVEAWAAQWTIGGMSDTKNPPESVVPGDVPYPRGIRSYVRRAGRTTVGQAKALETLGPRFLVPYQAQPVDLAALFGRDAPTILEIGFGMGEATAHIASVRPDDNFLCCEVHPPGVGALLKRIGEQQLTNIRIVEHDAVEVLDHMLPPQSLAGVHIFFPDPWHKARHNKRRLVQPHFVAKLLPRMRSGAYIHCATDWEPYAQQILEVLAAEPQLVNTAAGFAPKPDYRPLTKFENRGLRLGHGVWDVVFRKT